MSIRVHCPHCERSFQVSESSAGKTITCPNCQEEMNVPEEVVDAEGFGASSTPRAFEATPERGREESDREPCPMCGEMIQVGAAKCRFCGEVFDPELRQIEKKKNKKKKIADGDADMSAGEWVVAILCSGIGCICGIIWMMQGKPKGSKMFGVSLVSAIVWNILRVAIEIGNKR